MSALEMDPGIRAAWTAALRSGEYRQGCRQLRHAGRYCCLGVLTDLALKAGAIGAWPRDAKTLTPEVQRWAGLRSDNPLLSGGAAAHLNDSGTPFAGIADLIDGIAP